MGWSRFQGQIIDVTISDGVFTISNEGAVALHNALVEAGVTVSDLDEGKFAVAESELSSKGRFSGLLVSAAKRQGLL